MYIRHHQQTAQTRSSYYKIPANEAFQCLSTVLRGLPACFVLCLKPLLLLHPQPTTDILAVFVALSSIHNCAHQFLCLLTYNHIVPTSLSNRMLPNLVVTFLSILYERHLIVPSFFLFRHPIRKPIYHPPLSNSLRTIPFGQVLHSSWSIKAPSIPPYFPGLRTFRMPTSKISSTSAFQTSTSTPI